MSSPKPDHSIPFLDYVIKFLQVTSARDKVYRLAAYYTRYLAWHLQKTQGDKDTIARISKFNKNVSEARKLFRVGRYLEYLQGGARSLDISDDFVRITSIIKNVSFFGWLWHDMLQWFNGVGVMTLADPNAVKIRTARFWALGLFFSVIINLYQLRENQKKLLDLQGKSSSADQDAAKKLKKERVKLLLDTIKNSLDLMLPLKTLEYVPLEDGHIGLIGVITSLMGAYAETQKIVSGK